MSPRARRAERKQPAGARPQPAIPAAVQAPPRLLRDPWALATVLAVLPLLARCWGAALGEPVAEDFDFLHRALFEGMGTLLDGGGSTAFWRPIPHQLYYAALAPVIASHPRVIATLHVCLLVAGALLVFRALRPHLGGPAACVAATFPMSCESTRTLVSWPGQIVDVGLYFFSAVSLHETTSKRLPYALAATLCALLCKEVAVITALIVVAFPDGRDPATRRRWAIAFGALGLAWAGAYLAVRHAAGLHLPHGVEREATPMLMKMSWALGGCMRALASLPLAHVPADAIATALVLGLLVVFAARAWISPAARTRLRARRAWIAWGAAWYLAGALVLAPIFPLWQPNRVHFASTGAGVAAAVALEAVHPALAGALVLGRAVLLFLAPAPAATITAEAPELGAFMDFARLSRLQRFMAITRGTLQSQVPHAAPRAHVVEMNLPHGLIYAFGGDRAVQVWYRDSTLSMVNYTRLNQDSTLSIVAVVQYQPLVSPPIVLLPPEALRAQDRGFRRIFADHSAAGLEPLALADSLTPDPSYVVFHADNAGYRAFALAQLNRGDEAEAEARRALALVPTQRNGLLVLGTELAGRGRLDEAQQVAERLLKLDPNERSAQRLHASIVARRGAGAHP